MSTHYQTYIARRVADFPDADAYGDAKYAHIQPVPATVWTVVHGLNKRPAVTVTDSAGTVVSGTVQYDNDNELTITFAAAFSGRADCN